ncbi:hypothetical protein SLEP1_g5548 [Rubroshorea leprosula]|uniref:WPP domain-associated protein n=1 Tax=Rubroshorea leprosula TaxID=152421 RepID=A0AAV5I332_9ROSI|nr:hypothetical protein SLEP1_g5548 [Rubroshorea leprosula]
MDQILGQMEFRVSLTESTMMRILQCAMDRAHEKLKSKKGVLEGLNGISKFYELAVMQLEGCLKFVQEEMDRNPLESNYNDVLLDLMEIKDRLQGRIREADLAISEKDRELMERLANEKKLRQVLKLKEREVGSLRADLELEKTKSGEIEELILNNRVTTDEEREGQFCELKNSVDQQVWNIKQQLEPDPLVTDEDRTRGIENRKVEQMGSDINILKDTLDLAFGKMHNAMFLSELGPVEHQWRWKIERVTTATVIKGSLKDFQEKFEEEVKKREMQVSMDLSKNLSGIIREMTCLHHELELLSYQDEVEVENTKGSKTPPLVPHPNPPIKSSLKARGESSSAGNSDEFYSFKVEEGQMEQAAGKDLKEDAGLVAKMIKNHESIIRRKSEELNFFKPEMFQERRYPSFRREKESVSLKRRIEGVMVRLESLINWSSRLGDICGDCKQDYREESSPEKRLFIADMVYDEKSGMESMEEVWAKLNKTCVSHAVNEEQYNEMRMLKQELEDANLLAIMMEETFLTVFKGNRIEAQIIEEIYGAVFREATKDFGSSQLLAIANCQGTRKGNSCLGKPISACVVDNLGGTLREDTGTFLFQEIYREWNGDIESYMSETLIKEKIYLIVFDEIIGDIINTANFALSKLQETKATNNFYHSFHPSNKSSENVDMLIEDDIWKVLLSGMVGEWKMNLDDFNIESLIREDLHQFVIVETVKETFSISGEAETQKLEKISENLFQADKLCGSPKDCLGRHLELEEGMQLSTCSEIKEQNLCLDLVGLKNEGLDEHQIFQKRLSEESVYTSANSKLEKDLKQFGLCKAHFSPYAHRSGIAVGDQERVDRWMNLTVGTTHKWQLFISQSKDTKEIETSKSLLNPIPEMSEVLKGFEAPLCKRLDANIMRLDEMKHQLDLLVELTKSLRKRESLYRKAFLRRCENLRKAEAEVDLLGDQVDALLGLLEKLYRTLCQHSVVFQQYFEVGEILKLIKKELVGGMNA